MSERKNILLRLDPAVHDALARWAGDELRSTNAQIELLLRRALAQAGRLPRGVGDMPRRGRPPKSPQGEGKGGSEQPTVSQDVEDAASEDAASEDAASEDPDNQG